MKWLTLLMAASIHAQPALPKEKLGPSRALLAPPVVAKPISQFWVEFNADLVGWAKVLVSTNVKDWRVEGMTAHAGNGWNAVEVYPLESEKQMLFVKVFALNGKGEWTQCPTRVKEIVR